MKSRQDFAVSETIGTILIILLVVLLAAIVLTLATGITILPKKPVLAGFSVDVVKGADTNPPPCADRSYHPLQRDCRRYPYPGIFAEYAFGN